MNKLFDIVIDSRDLSESTAIFAQRIRNMGTVGKHLRDAAITEWQLYSDNMPIGGDTGMHITIMQHFTYDVATNTIVVDINTYALMRDIYRAYGQDSTIPSLSKIPGAIDLRVTLSIFE